MDWIWSGKLFHAADPLSIIFLRHGDLAPPWLQLAVVTNFNTTKLEDNRLSEVGISLQYLASQTTEHEKHKSDLCKYK